VKESVQAIVAVLGIAVLAAALASAARRTETASASPSHRRPTVIVSETDERPHRVPRQMPRSEADIDAGLRWLAAHQSADGSWHDPATTGSPC
jgi:hypothetical protein